MARQLETGSAVTASVMPAEKGFGRLSWRTRVALSPVALSALIIGIALRAWLLTTAFGRADSDESVGGLAARLIMHGHWYTFLPGNNYGGTLVAIVAAPATLLWDSAVVLKVAEMLLFGTASALIWRLGLRTVGQRAAILGAAIFLVFPGAFVLASTKGRLYYSASLNVGLLLVLLVLRIVDRPTRRDAGLLGLVAGLGLWAGPYILYFAFPAGAWLLLARPAAVRRLTTALPTAIVGAAPWLIYNLQHEWSGLQQKGAVEASSLQSRFLGFWNELLPKSLGLRQSYSDHWLLGGELLSAALIILLALGFGVAAVSALRRRSASRILFLIGLTYPVLFAIPRANSYVAEPRYGLFLMPVVVLLLGQALARVIRPAVLQVVAVVALGAVSWASLINLKHWSDTRTSHFDLTAPKVGELAKHLRDRRVSVLFADYWIAYRLTAATNEEIVASPYRRRDVRINSYERRVLAVSDPTYVFFSVSPLYDDFARSLASSGIPYTQERVNIFSVFKLARPIPR